MDTKQIPLPDDLEHWKQLKESEYIGHWDLPQGKNLRVKIKSVHLEDVTNVANFQKERKVVASFQNAKKRLILNATNQEAIASWHGNNPKTWVGKEIELTRSTTRLKGEVVECIRVKPNDKRGKSATDSAKKNLG